jgi:undecaprenyl diphosphate synthase
MKALVAENSSLQQKDFLPGLPRRLDPSRVPHHVALIMDGNRRWAQKRGLPVIFGHRAGAANLNKIVKAAADLGVKVLTVYAFSTENWKNRSSLEVHGLMQLFRDYLLDQRDEMIAHGVRLQSIGDLSRFPKDVLHELEESRQATSHCTRIELVLALNYGGRDDIRRAAIALLEDFAAGKIAKDKISEEVFARYLDTSKWMDPVLFIRPGGERRLSNFLLWQLSYAEVYVSDILWPDFDERQLLLALEDYQQRERRLGG